MQTENYKKRAVDVRRTARASLLEIRQARLAKRTELLDASKDTIASEIPETAHPKSVADLSTQHVETQQIEPKEASVSDLPAANGSEQEMIVNPEIETDALDELAAKNALDDTVDLTVNEDSHGPVDATAAVEEDTKIQIVEDWQQSELAALPGAGPGLIWMLGQCKVATLAQLSEQDPGDLASRLGVVGQIIDVGQWIAFAKERAHGSVAPTG